MTARQNPFQTPVHVRGKTCLRDRVYIYSISANTANMVFPRHTPTGTVMFPMLAGNGKTANTANTANI